MEFDILDSLDDLGYPDCTSEDSKVKTAIETGLKSVAFTQLIEWFSKELQSQCELESYVNSINDPEDSSSFLVEVSSFLKELQCPYKSLTSGDINQRLFDVKSRIILLDFLCTELQAARLLQRKARSKGIESEREDWSNILYLDNATKLLDIKADINDNLAPVLLEMQEKISSKHDLILPSAFEDTLNKEQWAVLTAIYEDMHTEYSIRRDLMLSRLDVTLQSFKWGEHCQDKESKILDAYIQKRNKLKKESSVKLIDLIAARTDLFIIEKTSSANLVKNTKSSLNRILINAVPDRGGRPKEQRPYVEMPSWSKRSAGGGGGRGDHRGRGGRGGHRGHGKKFKDQRGGRKGGGSFDAAGSY